MFGARLPSMPGGGGSNFDPASPGPIGGTTPGAITGTTVTATTSPTTLGNGSAATHSLATNLSGGTDPSIDFQNNQIILNNTQNLIINWVSPRLALATNSTVVGSGANQVTFGGNTSVVAGYTTTRTEINKAVTGIANNTATPLLTFTIPNAAHSATYLVHITGILGAGGAIGAHESADSGLYLVTLTRTAGLATVATISAQVADSGAASVAGAANATMTAAMSAMAGANGATQTCTLDVTIARSGGTSANHIAQVHCTLLNVNASGVTVA